MSTTLHRAAIQYESHRFEIAHCDPFDLIFETIRTSEGFYEIGLLESLRRLLKPGDLVIDVGANIGNHSLFFAGVCGCRVLAVEPVHAAYCLLEHNVQVNGLQEQIATRMVALGDATGRASVREPAEQHNLGATTLTVDGRGPIPVTRLDDIALEGAPRLIKIDAEGMERAILRGARSTLTAARPIVCVEAKGLAEFDDVFSELADRGYLVGEVHNYSPTHVFVPARPGDDFEVVALLSHFAGASYIRWSEAQKAFLQNLERHDSQLRAEKAAGAPALDGSASRQDEALLEALGEQAADLAHVMSRWFEQLTERVDELSARLAAHVSAPGGALLRGGARPSTWRRAVEPEIPRRPDSPTPTRAGAGRDRPIRPRHGALARSETVPDLACAAVVSFDTQSAWGSWAGVQAVELKEGGVVEIRQDQGAPGAVSDLLALPGGGLFRITVSVVLDADGAGSRPCIYLEDLLGRPLSPRRELANGDTELLVFLSNRTTQVRVGLVVLEPSSGSSFRVNEVRVEAIDRESFYRRRRASELAPTVASLASIPSRSSMLRDCVDSLLLQCDRVRVFLNGYQEIPEFLLHPRVEVRRSQDWDDRGDAGKFSWVADDEPEPGYRFIVDDDLIFPPDFVETLCRVVQSHDNQAIVAMHGVLLKQPLQQYYQPDSRSVFHFQSELECERTVHILGTNALCYHSERVRMSWQDFMHSNMADIFLARYAQERHIPMVTPPRPKDWVLQNSQVGGFATIYDHSLRQSGTRFDSSLVQSSLVRWMAPLTIQASKRPKIVLVLVATTRADFDGALESWELTRSSDYDWALVIVAGAEDDALRDHVAGTRSRHELHVVDRASSTAAERIESALSLAEALGGSALCVAVDAARFRSPRWIGAALRLCAGYKQHVVVALPPVRASGLPDIRRDLGGGRSAPVLVMVGRDVLGASASMCASCGQGLAALVRWTERAVEIAGEPPPTTRADLRSLAETISTHESERLMAAALPHAGAGGPKAADCPVATKPRHVTVPALSIERFFDRVLVINLERRFDRWERVTGRLEALGVRAGRIRAVDGTWPEVAAEYAEYAEGPLHAHPVGAPRVGTSREFFLDYASQAARVAYLEHEEGRKAIQSSGAWGYLKTWQQILERVLSEQIPRTLVLDDDVVFHPQTRALFAAAAADLPEDWLILQLGSLQYHWEDDWIRFHNRFLYHPNGAVVGSHAVGFHYDVAPFLLEQVRQMQLPFDTGALSAATCAFKDRCFVVYPNIAMQDLSDPSDINTSRFQSAADHERILATYRWVHSRDGE